MLAGSAYGGLPQINQRMGNAEFIKCHPNMSYVKCVSSCSEWSKSKVGQKARHHREGRGINSSNRGNCTHLQSLFMVFHLVVYTTSDDIWMTGWKKRAWERSPNPAYFLCYIQPTNGRLMWAFYSDCPLWKVRKIVRCSTFKTVYEKMWGREFPTLFDDPTCTLLKAYWRFNLGWKS